jgi:hypothetical protein
VNCTPERRRGIVKFFNMFPEMPPKIHFFAADLRGFSRINFLRMELPEPEDIDAPQSFREAVEWLQTDSGTSSRHPMDLLK